MFLRNLAKFQKVKTFTQCLKFTTKDNFIKTWSTLYVKTVIFNNMFVYP